MEIDRPRHNSHLRRIRPRTLQLDDAHSTRPQTFIISSFFGIEYQNFYLNCPEEGLIKISGTIGNQKLDDFQMTVLIKCAQNQPNDKLTVNLNCIKQNNSYVRCLGKRRIVRIFEWINRTGAHLKKQLDNFHISTLINNQYHHRIIFNIKAKKAQNKQKNTKIHTSHATEKRFRISSIIAPFCKRKLTISKWPYYFLRINPK